MEKYAVLRKNLEILSVFCTFYYHCFQQQNKPSFSFNVFDSFEFITIFHISHTIGNSDNSVAVVKKIGLCIFVFGVLVATSGSRPLMAYMEMVMDILLTSSFKL